MIILTLLSLARIQDHVIALILTTQSCGIANVVQMLSVSGTGFDGQKSPVILPPPVAAAWSGEPKALAARFRAMRFALRNN